MDEDGVPVSVGDGFLKSFAPPFLSTFGADSLFVRTVSDFLATRIPLHPAEPLSISSGAGIEQSWVRIRSDGASVRG